MISLAENTENTEKKYYKDSANSVGSVREKGFVRDNLSD